MLIALLVACVVQDANQPAFFPGNDVPMQAAVEEFVACSMLERNYDVSLARVLGDRSARAIRALGSAGWQAREFATEVISERSASPDERAAILRALLWGELASDPEIRLRAGGLLDTLFRCRTCKGSGICPYCMGRGAIGLIDVVPCNYCRWKRGAYWICGSCDGTGRPQP